MPKPRVIDGGFFDDLDIALLARDERLLMIAIISKCADDYGRLIAHPAYLRKQAFGYDEDISIDDVRTMRAHILEHCRNVLLYQDNGQEYICLINWDKWQKIRYRIDSKLPPPPSIDGKLPVNSRESDAKVTVNSPRVEQSRVEQGCLEQGRVEQSRVEQGRVEQSRVVAAGSLQNLLDIGMDPETAQALADEHPEANVLGWCAESRKRKLENPPGWVRSMLVRGHSPPAAYDNGLAGPANA